MKRDGNSPGVFTCGEDSCLDRINPYRLPPRQPDPIALPWIRPLVELVATKYVYSANQEVLAVVQPGNYEQQVLVPGQSMNVGFVANGNTPPLPNEFSPLPNEIIIDTETDIEQQKVLADNCDEAIVRQEYLPPRLRRKV
jgi:hypothetical protein